jgi:hypothetical protein
MVEPKKNIKEKNIGGKTRKIAKEKNVQERATKMVMEKNIMKKTKETTRGKIHQGESQREGQGDSYWNG